MGMYLDETLGITGKALEFLDAVDEWVDGRKREDMPKPPGGKATQKIIEGLMWRYMLTTQKPRAEEFSKRWNASQRLKRGRLTKANERESEAVATMKKHLPRGIDFAIDQCSKVVPLGRSRLYEIAKKHGLTKSK